MSTPLRDRTGSQKIKRGEVRLSALERATKRRLEDPDQRPDPFITVAVDPPPDPQVRDVWIVSPV